MNYVRENASKILRSVDLDDKSQFNFLVNHIMDDYHLYGIMYVEHLVYEALEDFCECDDLRKVIYNSNLLECANQRYEWAYENQDSIFMIDAIHDNPSDDWSPIVFRAYKDFVITCYVTVYDYLKKNDS